MDKLVVEGGRRLEGEVDIAGSKNAVLPVLAAALLTRETLRVENAPRLADVESMLGVLRDLGCAVQGGEDEAIEVKAPEHPSQRTDWELVSRMRASFCVLGPLVARTGRAEVSLPGDRKSVV